MPSFVRLPYTEPGMRIGILGGSFDPAHYGHRLISLRALKSMKLDQIWWLVTPGNPLKSSASNSLEQRLSAAKELANHRKIIVTGVEAQLKSRYTADTLSALKERLTGRNLVWIMGGDNLATFHHWDRWRRIATLMPIAVIDRPGATLRAMQAPAAAALARFRLDENDAERLPGASAPAWLYLHGPRTNLSSTQLRRENTKKLKAMNDRIAVST